MHLSGSTNKAPPFGGAAERSEAERVTQKSRPALWEPGGSCYAVFRTLPEVCRLVVQALIALCREIHWAWPEWVYLPGIFLGLAAGAQNFWVFAKERMDRAKKDKNHRVGFNSHQ